MPTALEGPFALAYVVRPTSTKAPWPMRRAGVVTQQELNDALALERTLSDLINQAYHLTPDEVKLLWATAPPRMPLVGP